MDNTRTALIEMMRDYQRKEIDYFIGEEVLQESTVISDLSQTFLGCVLSLTLRVHYIVLDTRQRH